MSPSQSTAKTNNEQHSANSLIAGKEDAHATDSPPHSLCPERLRTLRLSLPQWTVYMNIGLPAHRAQCFSHQPLSAISLN